MCLTQVHFSMATILQNMQTITITTHKQQIVVLCSKEEQTNIQTAPGYATTNYYYQTDTRNDGSSGNNYAQSYQNYPSSDTNAAQSSSTVPANSFSYQQQYNQWPYYYNHSVPTPAGNPVAGSSNIDNTVVNTTSGYSYPSTEPPPPGTTPWKSNSSASVAPPVQAPSVPEPQNQYVQQAQLTPGFQNQYAYQAPGVPMSQNYYANQAPAYPQNNMNVNQVPLNNHGDQQKSGSLTTGIFSSENKTQIPTIPRIAPGFSMVIPKSEKKTVGADLAKKPAYVSVSVPKNDVKAVQHGSDAITSKAISNGTLLTKNWDTEPLIPLPENLLTMTET
ncbi:hypothetical protein CFC21_012595, partial [Triticum aestivum]